MNPIEIIVWAIAVASVAGATILVVRALAHLLALFDNGDLPS